MFVIPVVSGDHSYLVCFDVKNLAIDVLDSVDKSANKLRSKADKKLDEEYVGVCTRTVMKLKEFFVSYLTIVDHPKASPMERVEPRWLKLKCTIKGYEESGLFMMRHMETFKGGVSCGCGLGDGSLRSKKVLLGLRVKYTAKILLAAINKRKGIIDEAVMNDESLTT
ncbi:uncharacterized protein LOC143636122 [Bidens hawaiensis]|uniref:uncharacterized protein LOC143636122 n=1 Tax=Bidens hawaiensis TaxID=980011 RepID=UPI00404B461E